jgi:hypothetical protein
VLPGDGAHPDAGAAADADARSRLHVWPRSGSNAAPRPGQLPPAHAARYAWERSV